MSDRPRLLDLFCGAGGCSVGYERAGFDVIGVDIAPQPHYPFEFVQADAVALKSKDLSSIGWFDAVHASPPCQHFTAYRRAVKDITDRYDDLIEPTRDLLARLGLPYVIENVEGAPLRDPLMLCGSMFDLDVRRHRLFETNWPLAHPTWGCRHKIWSPRFKSSTGRKPHSRLTIEVGSWDEPIERQKEAMGVDWTVTTRELSEAIPPVYTEFVGRQLLDFLGERNLSVGDGGDPPLNVADDLIDRPVAVVGEFDVQVNQDCAGHGGLLSVDASDSPKPAPNVKEVA